MRQVLASRDANWKKLQQYVLDERELIELTGPGRIPLWGERREYTWYIRDGFFVRSPLRFNGVEIGDGRTPEVRGRLPAPDAGARQAARPPGRPRPRGRPPPPGAAPRTPTTSGRRANIDALIRQTREPEFISSAYFLRFKFEEGKYALVGRETLDGRDVLRIEYYPDAAVPRHRSPPQRPTSRPTDEKARDAQFQRLMNKVALVTLWVEPKAHQIVKYTFDNVGFDFLPAQWLVHVERPQGVDDDGAAVSRCVAAERRSTSRCRARSRSASSTCATASTTTTTAVRTSRARSASSAR